MLLRLSLVASALLVVVLLAGRLGDDPACSRSLHEGLRLMLGAAEDPQRIADRAREHCGDEERLAEVSLRLVAAGYPELGEPLVRDAVRRAPESFRAWAALARVDFDAGRDPRAAMRRAHALNPWWTLPAPLPEPRRRR